MQNLAIGAGIGLRIVMARQHAQRRPTGATTSTVISHSSRCATACKARPLVGRRARRSNHDGDAPKAIRRPGAPLA